MTRIQVYMYLFVTDIFANKLQILLVTCIFGRKLMTIEEAFVELESYVDASDPDLDLVRGFSTPYMLS